MSVDPGEEQREERAVAGQLAARLVALRRRWRLIALTVLLLSGAVVGLSLAGTDQYDAKAKILVRQEPIDRLLDPDAGVPSNDPERLFNTSVELVTEQPVARRVRDRLRLSMSPAELRRKVRTDTDTASNLVSIVARDEDPARAAAIANAFAEEYAAFRQRSARASYDDAAALARRQLESLDAAGRASSEGTALASRLREFEIAAALQTGGVEVVRTATVPDGAATPRPVFNGILATLVALVLGSGLALALERMDRRIKDEEGLEAALGLPLLATIPRGRRRHAERGRYERSEVEGYGTLATNLRFFRFGTDLKVLMVTSAVPDEGKTNVTFGLARALMGLGQRVVLIEADLRRPSFGEQVELPTGRGLTSVLAGVASFADEIVEVEAPTMTVVTGRPGRSTSFWILPAGPVPPSPQALLSGDGMKEVIREASALGGVVVIDTPPITAVNDALTLAGLVDGAIMVARLNKTTRDRALRAVRALRAREVPVLGVVATDAPTPTHGYYGRGPAPRQAAVRRLGFLRRAAGATPRGGE